MAVYAVCKAASFDSQGFTIAGGFEALGRGHLT